MIFRYIFPTSLTTKLVDSQDIQHIVPYNTMDVRKIFCMKKYFNFFLNLSAGKKQNRASSPCVIIDIRRSPAICVWNLCIVIANAGLSENRCLSIVYSSNHCLNRTSLANEVLHVCVFSCENFGFDKAISNLFHNYPRSIAKPFWNIKIARQNDNCVIF